MNRHIPWSWAESLGSLRPDPSRAFRVQKILFGLVRDRCSELGLSEGQEIRCRRRNAEQVAVQLPDGRVKDLELSYAWFIQVEPVPCGPSLRSDH